MTEKYILQYGNLAGWPYCLAESLRALGIRSSSLKPAEEDYTGPDGTKLDRRLPTHATLFKPGDSRVMQAIRLSSLTGHALRRCSFVHYHGSTFLRTLDPALFQMASIPRAISWAGGEARIVRVARKNNPYFYRQIDDKRDDAIKRRLEALGRFIPVVATDPELYEHSLPFFKRVEILRQPINMQLYQGKYPDPKNAKPLILHIPTHPTLKGTPEVQAVIERLAAEGLSFEFRFMEPKLTQTQVREQLGTADIYVDDLRCGSHGVTAVEAMASGKPVVTFIREDLLEKYPDDMPIVSANPDTLYAQLRKLILDADLRHELGLRGRDYATKYHSMEVIGPELVRIYQLAGWTQSKLDSLT